MEHEHWLRWFNGRQDAVAFMEKLGRVIQRADDLADGAYAEEERPRQIATLLRECLIDVSADPFFQQHRLALYPVMLNALLLWNASNNWGKDPRRNARIFGYVLRSSDLQIGMTMAMLCGASFDQAARIAEEMHSFYYLDGAETLEAWEKEQGR
jgi:hypothetical protein